MRAERLALSREEAPIKCFIGFHIVGTSILSTNGYEQMRYCKNPTGFFVGDCVGRYAIAILGLLRLSW